MNREMIFMLLLLLACFAMASCSCIGDDDDDCPGGISPDDDDDDSSDDDDDDASGDDDDAGDDDDVVDDDDDDSDCDGCLIDEICYPDRVTNPDNVCQVCDVSQAVDAWSNNDFSCDDGLYCNGDDTCFEGTCSQHAGDPCGDDGVFCNGDESCNVTLDQCDHSGDPCQPEESCNEVKVECYDSQVVVFIPEGPFQMGCEPEDLSCHADGREEPRHEITLSAYYIDIYEMTYRLFVDFLNDYGNDCEGFECVDADDPDLRLTENLGVWTIFDGYEDHPMVEVSWYGAKAYCEWAGARLPTEAEWEKAAKGVTEHFIYPWGDALVANASNYINSGDPFETGPEPFTNPIGFFDGSDHGGAYQTTDGASPFGAHDMAGNVWEWVSDWYDASYYSVSPSSDPEGPATGGSRVMRGGGWDFSSWNVRASNRGANPPDTMRSSHGFRCVWD